MSQGNGNKPGGQRTAYDLRRRFGWLNQFTDDELRAISLCDEGAPLREGAVYFDISKPERGEIVAHKSETVPGGSCPVLRDEVSSKTWQKLLSFPRSRQAGQ